MPSCDDLLRRARWSATFVCTASTRRPTGTARPATTRSSTARAAAVHLTKLLELLRGQDLRESRVNVFLKLLQFTSLGLGQIELVLQERWQDLSGLRTTGPSRSTSPRSIRPTGTLTRLTARTSLGRPAGATRPTSTRRPDGCRLLCELCIQFFLRDNPILIGIRPLQERLQTLVGDLVFGKLAVTIRVKSH